MDFSTVLTYIYILGGSNFAHARCIACRGDIFRIATGEMTKDRKAMPAAKAAPGQPGGAAPAALTKIKKIIKYFMANNS